MGTGQEFKDPREMFALAVRLRQGPDFIDDTGNEYWNAVRALHGRPERVVFEQAAALCRSEVVAEREVGADVLAQLGLADEEGVRPFSEETLPILRGLLTDLHPEVLASAIYALGHQQIGNARDFESLARHPSNEVREAIAFSIGFLDDDAEARTLMMLLMRDEVAEVRDWATFAIGTQSDVDTPEIRAALTERLTDPDDETRAEAMVGLARRGDRDVIDFVVEALGTGESGVIAIDAADEILARYPDEMRVREALAKWRSGDPD